MQWRWFGGSRRPPPGTRSDTVALAAVVPGKPRRRVGFRRLRPLWPGPAGNGPLSSSENSASHTVQYFHTCVAWADPQAFLTVLERIKQVAGPVAEGDELEQGHGAKP